MHPHLEAARANLDFNRDDLTFALFEQEKVEFRRKINELAKNHEVF